jgi:hypothetical protein
MKKLFFTAIAMVAFSSASMANTIEEKAPKKSTIDEELKSSTVTLQVGCVGVWGSTRLYALNQGFTPDQASCMAMAALIACMGFDKAIVDHTVGTLC